MGEKSRVEEIKEKSRGLRGGLAEALKQPADNLEEMERQLAKFHGIYQQDNRDQRRERKKQGLERAFSCMVRVKIPGGILTADQYLSLDRLSEEVGGGGLRATNRQDIQIHGVLKRDLQRTVRRINDALLTTLGACGDVVRNVSCCPAPLPDRDRLQDICRAITNGFLPRTQAYHEIWLDGRQLTGSAPDSEPVYGKAYLPRKFKVGLAYPYDNCIEVHTNDIGLVGVVSGETLQGFNVVAGGSLGMSHGRADTYPRLATPIGYAPARDILDVVGAAIDVQRDNGNREDRARSRLKYLIDERGPGWFRTELSRRLNSPLRDPLDSGPFEVCDHLGWHTTGPGVGYLGIPVENGRITDTADSGLRTALRSVVERFGAGVRLTSQQNILLTDLRETALGTVAGVLQSHGVKQADEISPTRRWSMACPALPTCGLALAEAERVLPEVIGQVERELNDLELNDETISIRMTGCPNGCARPYTAELAFVGRTRDRYAVHVGGAFEGTRLTRQVADLVPLNSLAETVRPLLTEWKASRKQGEGFGDYFLRKDLE